MPAQIIDKLLLLPGILIGLAFHEYAHAQVAVWLGDDTPKKMGRLTISPGPHLDPLGFLSLLIVGFGWAKPVVINPNNFKKPRRDDILVSIAGPITNLILATIFLISIKIILMVNGEVVQGSIINTTLTIFQHAVWINLVLFVFNLLPFPPLDGSHVIVNLFRLYKSPNYHKIYNGARTLFMGLILIGVVTNKSIIGNIIFPPIYFMYTLLVNIIL